jgi:hypothetical protein
VWNPNGKEIIYLDDRARVASVEATPHGDSVELGKPKVLFTLPSVNANQFEISPDGQRFLMIQAPVLDSSNLTLVVNWPEQLKQ